MWRAPHFCQPWIEKPLKRHIEHFGARRIVPENMSFMTELRKTRFEIIEDLQKQPTTTIFIIGGGIHGAAFARLAALNGISCVLAERDDYASGTSSRSSKMAHGG